MLASSVISPKADVLKVGHHGSNSSTSPGFLKAVCPKYAVISVGANNDYGHPHKVTMDRLSKAGVQVFKTDEKGYCILYRWERDILYYCEEDLWITRKARKPLNRLEIRYTN